MPSVFEEEILKDADRTFPHNEYFSSGNEGNDRLVKVLKAISNY
jgi:hypothetical protein